MVGLNDHITGTIDPTDEEDRFRGPRRIEYRRLSEKEARENETAQIQQIEDDSKAKEVELSDTVEVVPYTGTVQKRTAVTSRTRITDFGIPESKSPAYSKVVRAHFVKEIIDDLGKLERLEGASRAAIISSILLSIREMRNYSIEDPIMDVLFAFYDSLTFEDRWSDYKAEQYLAARELFMQLAGRSNIYGEVIEKAIVKLEELGFDTLPYVLEEEGDEGAS